MSETPETVRLPETVEQFQKALRAAFEDGADWWCVNGGKTPVCSDEESRKRYPILRKQRREIRVGNRKYCARPIDSAVVLLQEGRDEIILALHSADVSAINKIASNPYEWVEE